MGLEFVRFKFFWYFLTDSGELDIGRVGMQAGRCGMLYRKYTCIFLPQAGPPSVVDSTALDICEIVNILKSSVQASLMNFRLDLTGRSISIPPWWERKRID